VWIVTLGLWLCGAYACNIKEARPRSPYEWGEPEPLTPNKEALV
jgi:hypothetical protein